MSPSPTDPQDNPDPPGPAAKRPPAKKATTKKAPPPKKAPTKKAAPKKAPPLTTRLVGTSATAPPEMRTPRVPEPPAIREPPTPPHQPTSTGPVPVRQPRAPNVPPSFPSTFSWFYHGLFRQPLGALFALLAGYTALFIALWYAALGMFLGVIVALGAMHKNGFTEALFHAGAGTSVTAVGVGAGALVGAGGGFTAFYPNTLLANELTVIGGLVAGAILAVAIVAVIAIFEGQLLSIRGYRQLSRDEVRRVSPLLQQLGIDMKLSNVPRFAMQDAANPAAWAHMRHIVLTTGLLDHLDDRELTAVIGHELEHWRVGDSVGLHFVWACAWPIMLLYNVAAIVSGRVPETGEKRQPTSPHPVITMIAWIIVWPAWILIKFPITLSVRKRMREQEYAADAAVKAIGYGDALISALDKLRLWGEARTGWERALYATHPPTQLRIAELSEAQPDDADHEEPPLGTEADRLVDLLYVAACLFAVFIVWGAVLNADRSNGTSASASPTTPSVGSSAGAASSSQSPITTQQAHDAEHAAATYTTTFIDDAFNEPAELQVMAQYVDPTYQQALSTETGPPNLYGVDPSTVTSSAQSVACNFYPSATGAIVDVFVRWTTSLSPGTPEWFSDRIFLIRNGTQWMATNLPDIFTPVGAPGTSDVPVQYQNSTPPSGSASCP